MLLGDKKAAMKIFCKFVWGTYIEGCRVICLGSADSYIFLQIFDKILPSIFFISKKKKKKKGNLAVICSMFTFVAQLTLKHAFNSIFYIIVYTMQSGIRLFCNFFLFLNMEKDFFPCFS